MLAKRCLEDRVAMMQLYGDIVLMRIMRGGGGGVSELFGE